MNGNGHWNVRWAEMDDAIIAVLCDKPLTAREITTLFYEKTDNDMVTTTGMQHKLKTMAKLGLINKCLGKFYRLETR